MRSVEDALAHLIDHLLGLQHRSLRRALAVAQGVGADQLVAAAVLLHQRADAPAVVGLGGVGADRFVFHYKGYNGDDGIADFTSGEDCIDLRGLGIDRIVRGAGALVEDVLRVIDRPEGVLLRADLDGDDRVDIQILALDCDWISRGDLLI